MKKGKKIEKVISENLIAESSPLSLNTDQEILDYLDKRKEENLALKKLLDNLNSTLSTGKPQRKFHIVNQTTKNHE